MPKYIKPNNGTNIYLTVDSTSITVDSTSITVDKIIISGNGNTLEIIPLDYVDIVTVTFYEEMKQTAFTETCIVTNVDGYMIIPFIFDDFKEGDAFEVTIRNSQTNGIIGREHVYVTMQDDLENFKLNQKNNNGLIYF